MNSVPFKEYSKCEPDKSERSYAWQTAIGLQAVDGLKASEYLLHTAIDNIEGRIDFAKANELLERIIRKSPPKLTPVQKKPTGSLPV